MCLIQNGTELIEKDNFQAIELKIFEGSDDPI
jgi:hypothetical protein